MSVTELNEALKHHLTGKNIHALAASLGYNTPESDE